MFKNLKIGIKLSIGFTLVILFMFTIILISLNTFKSLNSNVSMIVKEQFPKTIWANTIINQVNDNARAVRNALLTDDPKIKDEQIQRALAVTPIISKCLDSLKVSMKSDEEKALLATLGEKRAAYSEVRKKSFELINANKKQEAINLLFSEMRTAQNEYIKEIGKLIDLQNSLVNKAGKEAEEFVSSSTTLLYLIGIIAMILAMLIAWIITRVIVKPISKAVIAAEGLAKGDMKVDLDSDAKDETGMLLNAMKIMAGSVNKVVGEIARVAQAGIDGKLDTRADETQFQGEYKNVVAGFNATLNAVIGPLNVAAEYVDRISKGDIPPKITDRYNGDFNELKNNLNMAIDAVSLLVTDAKMLAKAAVDGKLDTRANTDKHQGDFRAIVAGVNDTLDSVIGPLNVAAEYVDRISKGDIPPKITDNYNGDFNAIKNNLNVCIEAVNLLVDDAKILAQAALEGKLDTRADASKHQGDFRAIVAGVNATLDNVIGPLNVAAEYVDRIAKGDIPPKITDKYNGDFNEIKNNLNMAIDSLTMILKGVGRVSNNLKEGKLDDRGNSTLFSGDWANLVIGINDIIDALVTPLNVTAEYVDRISKGDIPAKITDVYHGDFNEIKNNLNMCIDAISAMVNDAKILAKAAVEGKLDTRADASKHQGDFRAIVAGVNATLDSVIGPLNVAAEYVDRIAKGDIPPKITDSYNGDFNEIKNNLNMAIDAVTALVDDAKMLAKAAVEGKLDTRADVAKHQGDFRAIVAGVNATLDNVIGPLNVAAEYVDRIAKGDIPPKITDNYNGDFNEIKNNLNMAIDAVTALVTDAKMLAKAAVDGKLDTRADASKHQGDFRAIVAGVNDTLDSVIGPLNVAAEYVDRIAKGDIPPKISDNYNGDFNEIKNNLNVCIDSITVMVEEVGVVITAAKEGALDRRANPDKLQGVYRKLIRGVNETLDSVINPLNVAAEYVDRIAKGDIPPKITDNYNGDFNEIKNNLNLAIDAVNAMVADAKMLAKAAVDGKLETRADASKHQGDFRAIVSGVNDTLDSVIGPLNVAANYVDRISKGDIPEKITESYNGDFNAIKNNLNVCIDAVNAMVSDAKTLAKAAVEGKLDTRADASKHQGDFRAIVAGVNATLDSVIGPLNVAAEYVDRIAKGDIPPKITDHYNGDFNEIKNNLNMAIDAVNALVQDSKGLAQAALEGKLATRADVTHHHGDFRAIVEGVNRTLDSVIDPMNEAGEVLSIMATGDLTVRMEGMYQGDLARLKKNVNALAESLSELINQVNETVQTSASSAMEISATAESLAAASQEQSAQSDEVASAVEQMSRTISQNAMSANRTAEVAQNAGKNASEGGMVVSQTVKKMRDIATVVKNSADNIEKLGESSKQIGEIISVIDDIADQTNLLALNAAIEAARAGEQGRGFAVVADEVRKLAERTTEATKQIASMIKGIQGETEQAVVAMNKGNEEVRSGIELADKAGSSLQQILTGSEEVLHMINQIAAASEEQSATSEQISKNVLSISKVTAESAHRVEDVAHTADELAKLTEHLSSLMQNFKVHEVSGSSGIGNALHSKRNMKHLPPLHG